MLEKIPGTQLNFESGFEKNAFAVLTPLLSVTKGLTLSQISEVTSLQGSTIQNWVKRGWVANPKNRRYGERQVARIILINMVKSSLQLDTIVSLMKHINGSVEDEADDIIPDKELFNFLCYVIYQADERHTFDSRELKKIIADTTKSYKGPNKDSKQRLESALLIMSLAYISGTIQQQAQNECEKIGL